MAKVDYTLICFLPEKVYFADFKGTSLLSFREKLRSPTAESLDKALEDALLGEILGKKVVILESELWVQKISIPQTVHAKLNLQTLTKTLTFEAENFSGIPALDSKIGFVVLGKENQQMSYWVVQLPRGQFQQIEDLLTQYQSRLLGITHPGGLSTPIEKQEAVSKEGFKRIELWPHGAFFIYQPRGHKVPQLHIGNIAPHFHKWENEAEEWFQKQKTSLAENLLLTRTIEDENLSSFRHRLNLEQSEHAQAWLGAYGSALLSKPSSFPLMKPSSSSRPLPQSICLPLTLFSAFICFCLCFGLQYFWEIKNTAISQENAKLQQSLKKVEESQKKVKALQKSMEEMDVEAKEKKQEWLVYQEVYTQQRKRVEALIFQAANSCPENLVLQEIHGKNDLVKLRGVCVKPELADQYAEKLHRSLKSKGWEVGSAMKVALKESLWEFDLNIKLHSPVKIDKQKRSLRKRKLPIKTNGQKKDWEEQ